MWDGHTKTFAEYWLAVLYNLLIKQCSAIIGKANIYIILLQHKLFICQIWDLKTNIDRVLLIGFHTRCSPNILHALSSPGTWNVRMSANVSKLSPRFVSNRTVMYFLIHPSDLRWTPLSCVFNALSIDTPLGHIQCTLPNHQISHIWLLGNWKGLFNMACGMSLKRTLKMQLETLTSAEILVLLRYVDIRYWYLIDFVDILRKEESTWCSVAECRSVSGSCPSDQTPACHCKAWKR